MTTHSVSIPIPVLTVAVRGLINAFRFTEAAALLDAAPADSQDVDLVVARAEFTVADDWRKGDATPVEALAASRRIIDAHGDAAAVWDLDYLSMRSAYSKQLFHGTRQRRNHGTRDLDAMNEVRRLVEALRDSAPDERRRGWAEMYLGLTADNVFGERDDAPKHYTAALAAAEATGEDHLVFEALRHLGDHDHDAGDHELTRQRWERSARHAAKGGLVGGTLAQLVLVAVSARDRGDEAGAILLATEVARWADTIGYDRIREQAEGLIAGVDPTAEPEDDKA